MKREAKAVLTRDLPRGIGLGLVAGGAWWLVEGAANWALGGTITLPAALTILGWDLLLGVAVDRGVGLALRRDGLRLGLELAAAAVALVVWGEPLSTAALDAPMANLPPAAPGAPDVILVSLDTTRADHMSTYGYARETSPNVTALAKDALNFTRARSPAEWTVPGHASMLTGMYPSRHGAHYAGSWNSGPE